MNEKPRELLPQQSKFVKALEAIGGSFLWMFAFIGAAVIYIGLPLAAIFVVVYLAVKAAS